MNKTTPDKKKYHPDYGLSDQGAGRCPYCLASADMDCDCEATPTPDKEKWEEAYEARFLKKRKLSDGSSSEYLHLKGTALDTDLQDFIRQTLASQKADTIALIEGMKIKHPVGSLADENMSDREKYHNKVLSEILSILRKER